METGGSDLQSATPFSQVPHTERKLIFRMCYTCMFAKRFVFILQEMTTGISWWTERRGRWNWFRDSETDSPMQCCTSMSWYIDISRSKISAPRLFTSVCVLQSGLPGWWPEEVFSCDSAGSSSGSEPLLSGVWRNWISRLCNCRKEPRLSGQHVWQQSPDVTCRRSRLW